MKNEVKKILDKLDKTDEIIRLKELQKNINNNDEYINLMNEFIDNKNNYILTNTYNDELIALRKKLFAIDDFNEYVKLQSNLRLLSININNIILSILDNNIKCK